MLRMNLLSILASIVIVTSAFRVARQEVTPNIVQCGDGIFHTLVFLDPSKNSTIVRSSNFGKGDYNNNDKCVVQFETDNKPLVLKLTFKHFELESATDCIYDAVCVHGIDYCSTTLANSTFAYGVPANSTFSLNFRTDGSVTKSGFEVEVEAAVDENSSAEFYEDRCLAGNVEMAPTPVTERFFSDYGYITNDYQYVSDYGYDIYGDQYATDSGYDVYGDQYTTDSSYDKNFYQYTIDHRYDIW